MAREIAAAQDVDESIAIQKVAEALAKGGRMQRKQAETPVGGEESKKAAA
jgi:hypothetical protein